MERNHICKKCGGIAGWDSYFQSWICTRCGNEEPKPKTNADRIRAMTDENLAEWLNTITAKAQSYGYECADSCPNDCPLPEDWLLWLKEEVKA